MLLYDVKDIETEVSGDLLTEFSAANMLLLKIAMIHFITVNFTPRPSDLLML
jgi:hypothetical protein